MIRIKKTEGFTIIEVMIVLAIAGLILAVVLIAIPQLQRNQRNGARRALLNRVNSEVLNYETNNKVNRPSSGFSSVALPSDSTVSATNFIEGFAQRYLGCSSPNVVTVSYAQYGTCEVDINDPRRGVPVHLYQGFSSGITEVFDGNSQIRYNLAASCSDTTPDDPDVGMVDNTQLGVYALAISLEGGAIYCVDNT